MTTIIDEILHSLCTFCKNHVIFSVILFTQMSLNIYTGLNRPVLRYE